MSLPQIWFVVADTVRARLLALITQTRFFTQARTRAKVFRLDAAEAAGKNVKHAQKLRHIIDSGLFNRLNVPCPFSTQAAHILVMLLTRTKAGAFDLQRKSIEDVNILCRP